MTMQRYNKKNCILKTLKIKLYHNKQIALRNLHNTKVIYF